MSGTMACSGLSSLKKYSDGAVLSAANELNGRPRKRSGCRTPKERFEPFLDTIFVG